MGCERTEHDDAATLNASSIKCFGQGDFVLGGIDAFTLASDTAQSIDKGVAFRIQSIRALFYTHLADPEHEAFRSRLTQSLIDSLEAFPQPTFASDDRLYTEAPTRSSLATKRQLIQSPVEDLARDLLAPPDGFP